MPPGPFRRLSGAASSLSPTLLWCPTMATTTFLSEFVPSHDAPRHTWSVRTRRWANDNCHRSLWQANDGCRAKVIKHPHKARLSVATAGRRRLSAWLISDVEQCSMARRTVSLTKSVTMVGGALIWCGVVFNGKEDSGPRKSVTMVGGKGPMHGSRSPFGRRYTV